MPLAPGTHLGPYEVVGLLGAGGMGEVYRARDPKLRRDVALKLLPPAFAVDPDRRARFTREAQVLASLNHPHIAAIHGIEESGDRTALVLELVEGSTLAERIAAGPIPVDEALKIASQIVDALEAAHEKGIVHRDLKPANIKITPDDCVKVLDFGLAKALGDESAVDAVNSPTMTALASRLGMIVGTAAYMSPEQAKGRAVDKRADIWAFGCVLYEVLTGQSPFGGDVTDSIVAIMTKDPDWSRLPAATPPRIVRLMKRCLKKDARERLRDIGDARPDLELGDDEAARETTVAPDRSRFVPRALWFLGGAALAAAIGSVWFVWGARAGSPGPSRPLRFAIPMPPGREIGGLAISADGNELVYVADVKKPQLNHRSLDRFDIRPIPGTEGAEAPFFSPDGQWVGFFADSKLKKVALRGGAPRTICEARGLPSGATWFAGAIVFASDPATGLMRVSSDGGTPEGLTRPARGDGEIGHLWPQALPGGKDIVFSILSRDGFHLAALSGATGRWHRLGPGGKASRYVTTGHLVFAESDSLAAVPFDRDRLEVAGPPMPLLDGVGNHVEFGEASVYFAVASNGSLAYVPNALSSAKLVSVDRSGRATVLRDEGALEYTYPRVSPDGRRLAAGSDAAQIWTYDLERGTRSRVTNGSLNYSPLWSPDGLRLSYGSYVSGSVDIVSRPADLSGPAAPLVSRENRKYPVAWAPDGRLVFQEASPATGGDIRAVDPKSGSIADIVATPAEERNARLSPDGRWLAYVSDETGRFEVYVRPFDRPGGATPISTNGGTDPVWSPKGDEVFYFDGKALVSASVTTKPSFAVRSSVTLFDAPYEFGRIAGVNYDVTPDGQRFIMMTAQQPRPMHINIVLNWFSELERNAPAGVR